MSRILLSLTLVVAMAAMAVGGSFAVFNDQVVIAGNTIATSGFDVTVNHSDGKPFDIDDAYPGWESEFFEYLDIYNTTDLPIEAMLSFEMTGGSQDLYDELTIVLKTSGHDADCENNDAGEGLIYEGRLVDYPSSTVVSSIDYWHLANEDDASGPNDNIRPGYTERICQKIGIHPDADGSIEGQSVTFNEIVDAVQDND